MGVRRIGVAMDFSRSSKYALQWTLDNMVREHDHLVILIVNKPTSDDECIPSELLDSGSPLIPLYEFEEADMASKYRVSKLDPEVFSSLDTVTRQKDLVVVIKVLWGDAREKLCDAVHLVHLDSIVVGNRGLGPLKRLLLGSVSAYLVNNAACPVTVVKVPVRDRSS